MTQPSSVYFEHKGWRLHCEPEDDGDGFTTDLWYAVKDGERRELHHSRFSFTPTLMRFAYLVDAGFPSHPPRAEGRPLGPWSDADVDAAIERDGYLEKLRRIS